MPSIYRQRITSPSVLGGDGLELSDGQHYDIIECIIDLSGWSLDEIDECIGITHGSSLRCYRSIIRGAGKLILCGCGDKEKTHLEKNKFAYFEDCIFEDFSRRGPEVQDGMHVTLYNCLIRNWGCSSSFNYNPKMPDRAFGAWAHTEGSTIDAVHCVFWQNRFYRPIKQMLLDFCHHVGQAWNDRGFLGLLNPLTYIPGVCRGLTATDGGKARAWQCWKNKWWIQLPWRNTTAYMSRTEAFRLINHLEQMAKKLDNELPSEVCL